VARTPVKPPRPNSRPKSSRFSFTLEPQLEQLASQEYLGKINGADGNFNGHSQGLSRRKTGRKSRGIWVFRWDFLTTAPSRKSNRRLYRRTFRALRRSIHCVEFFARCVELRTLGYFRKTSLLATSDVAVPHPVNTHRFRHRPTEFRAFNAGLGHLGEKLQDF
jgi:adenylosuccinate lyase